MDGPVLAGLVVRGSDWPHGLRCMECDRVLPDGSIYGEQLVGLVGETPVTEVVCADCDGGFA
jgi:hypothetical protein